MSTYDYDARRAVYTMALNVKGLKHQMAVAIEEFSEAQKELCKIFRGIGDVQHLAAELADVRVCVEQMQMFYGIDELVPELMDQKVQRLVEKLREAVLKRMNQEGQRLAEEAENAQ